MASRRHSTLATSEEIRAAVKEQKDDFAAPVKSEFVAMKDVLAKEMRAELKAFVQEDISKNSAAGDGKSRSCLERRASGPTRAHMPTCLMPTLGPLRLASHPGLRALGRLALPVRPRPSNRMLRNTSCCSRCRSLSLVGQCLDSVGNDSLQPGPCFCPSTTPSRCTWTPRQRPPMAHQPCESSRSSTP